MRQINLLEIEEIYELRFALELYAVETLADRGAPPRALAGLQETWVRSKMPSLGPTRRFEPGRKCAWSR